MQNELIEVEEETYKRYIRGLHNIANVPVVDNPIETTNRSVMQTSVNGLLVAQAVYTNMGKGVPAHKRYEIRRNIGYIKFDIRFNNYRLFIWQVSEQTEVPFEGWAMFFGTYPNDGNFLTVQAAKDYAAENDIRIIAMHDRR